MYETGAPPAPPPLPADVSRMVDLGETAARVPVTVIAGYDPANQVLPPAPAPGTATYRLRGTETARTA